MFGALYPPVSQQSEAYEGEGAAVLIGGCAARDAPRTQHGDEHVLPRCGSTGEYGC
jgi:hypothetical protein